MIDGIINIFKEKGPTSHDVVARMRRIFKMKRIGHTGTLDPDATGVLPVCLGNATKLCELMTDKTKEYRAVMILGITTDTQDISGKITKNCIRLPELSKEDIIKNIMYFKGEYMQIPPMYSAIKVGGRKLVDLARQGIEIKREPRKVEIFDIEVEDIITEAEGIKLNRTPEKSPAGAYDIPFPRIIIKVCCSKGTYIRTLCHDIGERLGTGACMESLVRIRSGEFRIEDSISLGRLEELVKEELLREEKLISERPEYLKHVIMSIEHYFKKLDILRVKKGYERYIENGNKLSLINTCIERKPYDGEFFRVYDINGSFKAVYKYIENDNEFIVYKNF